MRSESTRNVVTTLALIPLLVLIGCDEPGPDEPEPEAIPGVALPEAGEPEPFLPGILDVEGEVRRVAFHPSGERIYVAHQPDPAQPPSLHTSEWDGESWSPLAPARFTDETEDVSPFVSHDGQYLLFSSFRPHDDAAVADESIWTAQWDPELEEWMDPWALPTVNSPTWDGAPSLAANANLYFSSFREGPAEGRDIYIAPFEDANWSIPEPLGEAVNSGADDVDPWVSLDERFLLFASNRDGAWNLYVSYRDEALDEWSEAESLDVLNTEVDEYAPTLSPDGEYLIFNRGSNEVLWIAVSDAGIRSPTSAQPEDGESDAGA